jgi:4-amino-4-deoxy-L-arabinose transferase-like glycosyltransferase
VKRFALKRYELAIFALILVATLARLVLISQNWPVTNSDEGNMALLARHVAYNGEWPIFFYGLPYMGPIEGYIAAPLFHLFGPFTFTLRLGLLPFFFLFAICMYYLTRRLYTPGLALFTVILLCFGSNEVIARELKAVGEYPEIVFFAAAICLLSIWLARSTPLADSSSRPALWRVLVYGLLGLIVGLALWVDFLILPFIGTGALFLLLFCRRELRSWAGSSLLLGIVLGAFPLIIYNVTAPLDHNSIAVLLDIHSSGASQHLPFLQQLVGTFLISLPSATGYNPLCSSNAFPYFHLPNHPASIPCIILHGGWSTGYLILWLLATVPAARFVWLHWRGTSLLQPAWTFEERQQMIRQCGRLMLLFSALGTLLLYALSPIAATAPGPTARYLICLLVALPAVLWPLWKGTSAFLRASNWRTQTLLLVRGCLLLLILAVYGAGTYRTFADIPNAQAAYKQQDELVQKLLALGATRIYSEYWTCNRLTFQSQEKIICSALDEHLKPGFDRYTPYRDIVRAAPHPAYVFPGGTQQVTAFDAAMKTGTMAMTYQRLTFQNYVIYLPNQVYHVDK